MIGLILNIIIFIIAFDLGREWEKLDKVYLSSQSPIEDLKTEYLKVEEGENSMTVSSCNKSKDYTVIYDKDIPITYT